MIRSVPAFIQGVFGFAGAGFAAPVRLDGACYTVPGDCRAQLIYLRAGNSADAMIALVLRRDGVVMRLFPVGARGAVHVPLAVVEDLQPGQAIEVAVAAEAGLRGTLVLDVGVLEV